VEYFCEAKPHKRDLQTVQPRSGVLLRLVMAAMIYTFRNYVFTKANQHYRLILLMRILTAKPTSGNPQCEVRFMLTFY